MVHGLAHNLEPWLGEGGSVFAVYALGTLAVFALIFTIAPGYVWLMRKIMARIQHRVGPYRVGPFGLLQPVADGIKLVLKEDVVPAHVDPWGYRLAPYYLLIPTLIAFLPIAWHEGWVVADVGTGLILVLALGAISPLGEILAGWASNNKYSMLGGIRAAALDVAYEVPLVITAVAIILLAGTMDLDGIVKAQGTVWFFILQPIGLFIFFTAALAKVGVAPLDLPEAESELVSGFHTEYGGMRFGMLFLNVFAGILLVGALTALLFFGGWQAPFAGTLPFLALIPGVVWFLGKTVLFSILVFVTWFTLPRIRVDQFLALGWKILFPLSLVGLLLAALEVQYLGPVISGGGP